MNTNVINPSVRFNGFSTLSIIGQSQFAVIFKVTCWCQVGDVRFDKLAKTWICTRLIGEDFDSLIFEYSLRGELRNPHKLLKSVRSKLMHLMNLAHNEFDREYEKTYGGVEAGFALTMAGVNLGRSPCPPNPLHVISCGFCFIKISLSFLHNFFISACYGL